MDQQQLNIADDIIQALDQTDAWQERVKRDPMIREAEKELSLALGKASLDVTDAITGAIAAHTQAAMIFGMHAAWALQEVASSPYQLSAQMLKRREASR